MSSSEHVQELLEANSTQKYYIEYDDFLSNHVAHAIIAFNRLGATDERLQQFLKHYVNRLENPDDYAKENKNATTNVDELKGKRVAYYVVLQHFLDAAKNCESIDDLIKQKFPKLSLGLVGSAFHGMIHTGYGYAGQNLRVVCDGLAYLHHSYLPLAVSNPKVLEEPLGSPGDTDILEVLEQFRQDRDLIDMMELKSTKLEDEILLNLGDWYGPRVGSLFTFKGDELLNYVNKIKLPDVYDPTKGVLSQLEPLLKWLVDCAITVYVMSETRNDFFLLHGVTSSWALRNVLPVIQNEAVINQSVRVFLSGLLATYMCQGCPVLNPKFLPSGTSGMFSWEKIIEQTLSRTDRDEHVYKLVQVCHEMSALNTDSQMAAVYKEATQIALMYPFVFT